MTFTVDGSSLGSAFSPDIFSLAGRQGLKEPDSSVTAALNADVHSIK